MQRTGNVSKTDVKGVKRIDQPEMYGVPGRHFGHGENIHRTLEQPARSTTEAKRG